MVFCVQNAFHRSFWSASPEEGQVLWTRAESNLEPSSWTGAESASAPKFKAVTLTARDDANDDPMDDTSTGRPDAKSTDDDAATAPMQVDQPSARTRRVYIAPKYCEPFMGSCPLCQVEYVSGQVTCTTCGYEPLPVGRKWRYKRGRQTQQEDTHPWTANAKVSPGFGMFGKMSGSLLTALTDEQANLLRRELGPRGITSVESAVLKDCRDRHRRAKALGYEDVEDRYSSDVTFCDRIHGEGKDLQDCIFDGHVRIWQPPRSPKDQSSDLGWRRRQCPKMKTAYLSWFSCPASRCWWFPSWVPQNMEEGLGIHVRPPHFYRGWICQLHRSPWRIPWPFDLEGHRPSFLLMALLNSSKRCMRKIFHWFGETLNAKRSKSAAAKAGGPGGHKADPTVAPTTERKRKAEADASVTTHDDTAASSSARADASARWCPSLTPTMHHFLHPEPPTPKAGARPFLEPETPPTAKAASKGVTSKAASSGRPDASWSWNRDHYGAPPRMEFLAWGLVLPWRGRRPVDLLEPQVDDDFLL